MVVMNVVKLMAWGMIMIAGKSLWAQNNPDVITYINTYKNIAISEMQRSGIPASIILAQGIHESEAGTSELVKKSNNHFGIKCKDEWKGPAVYHDDDSRQECFRSYSTPEESYRDHSDFLRNSGRYASLFQLDPDDYAGWAYGLKKAGYATNIHYPQILIKLVQDYNLQQYTLIAQGKLKPDEPTLASNSAPTENKPEAVPAGLYPDGQFSINNTPVVFARAGTSLLSIANQYELALARLMEFNDMKEEDVLSRDQLLFLQRKRRTGANSFHIVREGETPYDICQSEGLRYQDLLEMNQLRDGERPAAGEKIWLQGSAPSRPRLEVTRPIN
jgi:Mannosyl-glycoprotein endo-beta-N-acetylglucosaminidase/LysM domain